MPTYEYRCPECGTGFEKFQRMSEEPRAECPKCGAQAQRRMSAGAGLLFKGNGFYITDYRGDGYKKAAKAESGGTETSSSSEAGSNGASAPKPDVKASAGSVKGE
jgi:putative FmdB family regulatory protein